MFKVYVMQGRVMLFVVEVSDTVLNQLQLTLYNSNNGRFEMELAYFVAELRDYLMENN